MTRFQVPKGKEWKALARNDWGEILELSQRKVFQRKFQIVEALIELVAEKGYHLITHAQIAKKCGVTRQLVDHHFPNDQALLLLTYRYIYARLQKYAADALVSRQGKLKQFEAYVKSIPAWVREYRADARFLAHYFGIAPAYPELAAFLDRNLKIGNERIHALLMDLRDERIIARVSDERLLQYATSVQYQIFGYIVIRSRLKNISVSADQDELWRSCLAVVK